MKRVLLIVGLALVATGGALFSISRAARTPESSRVSPTPKPPTVSTSSLPSHISATIPPPIQPGQVALLRPPVTAAEKQAAEAYAAFVAAAQLSTEQETKLRQALWDAKRNRLLAKEEGDRAFREALEEFASVDKNGKKYMTKEDSERMARALAERGKPVDEQAFEAVDADTVAAISKILNDEQAMRFKTTFISPSSFAVDLPLTVR